MAGKSGFLGRRVGLWAAILVLPGVVALEPVAAAPGAQEPPEPRMPEVSSPELELPEPSIPDGEGALAGGDAPSLSLDELEELAESGSELVDRRGAFVEVFANENGSESVALHSEPVHFQPDGSTAWEKIDNSAVTDPARPGWVRNAANDWTVWFGPIAPGAVGGVEMSTDAGGMRFVPEVPAGAGTITPTIGTGEDADTVTYEAVWPGVDLRYKVSGGRVKEDIVVHDGGRADYPFVVQGLGLVPGPESAATGETVDLADLGLDVPAQQEAAAAEAPEETERAVVPMPRVTGALAGVIEFDPVTVFDGEGELTTAAGTDVSVEPYMPAAAASSDATVEGAESGALTDVAVDASGDGQRLVVSVDEAWLEDQSDGEEPVVVDPTLSFPNPWRACSYLLRDDHPDPSVPEAVDEVCNGVRIGTHGGHPDNELHSWWRSVAQFDYRPYVQGNKQIQGAALWMKQSNYGGAGGSTLLSERMDLYSAANFGFGAFPEDEWPIRQLGSALVYGAGNGGAGPMEGGCGTFGDACFDMKDALEDLKLVGDLTGNWDGKFAFTPDEAHLPDYVGDFMYEYSYKEFATSDIVLFMNVNTPPPAPTLDVPAEGSLAIDTLTPTLRWTGVENEGAPDNDALKYVARISTSPDGESGAVASSAEMAWSSAMSWKVPEGILRDGVTYYWTVLAGDGKTWTKANPRKLTVDRRMGLGGLSPSDSFGAVSTNLVTGNPSMTVSGPQMPAIGGGVGVNFVYNGRQPLTGLTGTYREDTNNNDVIDSSDPVRLVRTDSQVSFNWGEGTPAPGVPADNWFARWAGNIRFPSTGTWVLGQRSDDGARVRVDGNQVLDDWVPASVEPLPVWQTSGPFTAGSSHRISVDYLEVSLSAQVELWAKDTSAPPNSPAAEPFIVPADWLSPDQPDMPAGWSLSAADANISYIRSIVTEGTITLVGVDGATYAFTKQPNGSYKPPEGIEDLVIANPDGTVTVHDDAGMTYVFRPDGGIHTIRTALDDRKPAAAKNFYDDKGRLSQIKDPVSGRSVTFQYANGDGDVNTPSADRCVDEPPLEGASDYGAPDGMLCRVRYWDGTRTDLYYFSATGLLARIVNPGDAGDEVWHSFSYDNQARMVGYYDPMSKDVLWAGARTDSDMSRLQTKVTYDDDPDLQGNKSRVEMVELPFAMQADTQRPSRSYGYAQNKVDGILAYPTGGSATVTRAGVAGTYRSVIYDHRGRSVEETNAAGLTSKTYWNFDDLQIATETPDGDGPDGLLTATYYNARHQPTTVLGPAPKEWFDWIPYGVPAVLVPIPKPGDAANIPTSTTNYDEGLDGLELRWWNNPGRDGTPVAHQYDSGDLYEWDMTATGFRPENVPVNQVSGRWTGDIVFPDIGTYKLGLCVGRNDAATLYVDGHKLTSHLSGPGWYECSAPGSWTTSKAGEVHRLQIDYGDYGNDGSESQQHADMLHLNWIAPGTTAVPPVPASSLRPGYSLATSTVDADGKRTESRYVDTAAQIGPQHGLVTETIVDPGASGLNLSEKTGYEPAAGTAGFLRRVTRTLPAGTATTTTNTYYTADNPLTEPTNEAEAAAVSDPCPGATSGAANQGGMVQFDKAADPDGGGPTKALWREMVYDRAGRVVAARSGDAGTLTTPGGPAWTCSEYDGRGRATQVAYPAFGGQPARTVTSNYKVDPDGSGPTVASPLVTSVSDAAGTITVEADLLGRVISYKDVFGNTTTFQYDLAGREIQNSGPVGVIAKTYDNADRMTQLSRNSQVLANGFNYDAAGRLHAVTYPSGTNNAGNGTTGTFDYVTNTGRLEKITWTAPGGGLITSDRVDRRKGGDVVNQETDGVDPRPNQPNYLYDGAGRLTEAWSPGRHLSYGYGNNAAGCAVPNLATGKNTNRTSQAIEGGATTTYCYDNADRLTSSSDAAVATLAYDSHGNTTSIFNETHTYDAADRHMTTARGTTTVAYVRDATDRIVERRVGGTTVRYGSTGSGDAPEFTTNATNQVLEVTFGLPGGAMLTTRAGNANVWSYPNTHGDVVATASQSGVKQGATSVYDPYGNQVTGPLPDNSAGNFDYGWLGQHQRPLEHEGTLQPVIEMGARQYSPLLGRFLEVDPIEGGSCSDFDYVCGDPLNKTDLSGTTISECDVARIVAADSSRSRSVRRRARFKISVCERAVARLSRRRGAGMHTILSVSAPLWYGQKGNRGSCLICIKLHGYRVPLSAFTFFTPADRNRSFLGITYSSRCVRQGVGWGAAGAATGGVSGLVSGFAAGCGMSGRWANP